ncbi:MAG: hypothetical protein Q8S58_15030 [Bosea sp. (in: a-proteobacteria)]|uniref:hypothetical protein n=1 Tax=Bosea sp. (in: a-proteobacteria) TaxID=1871050 RepID=UPI002732945E|nr:hypothetical protein [Bosea sp. (in: a-proteobacteria)]MDP3255579.1 hypothetical protein [Bosea sp. (in: a-proteobacteria)]MDP3320437.1 hypothetical protein [Bosea sp. (in: a-proteobacteria)]
MIAEQDLQAAVAEGIIDQAQAVRIAHLARMRLAAQGSAPPRLGDSVTAEAGRAVDPDDERFRLIGGFNDVFVAIGVGLLAGALLGLSRVVGFGDAFAAVALVAAWGLSEIFARRMRLALPSILLAAMFCAAAALLVVQLTADRGLPAIFYGGWVLAAAAFAAAALLHHWRFRVPIDMALLACGGIGLFLALVSALAPALAQDYLDSILALCGLSVFALALRLDMRDPHRLTRRSDAAFWLHLLAAGLIVHPVFQGLVGAAGSFTTGTSLVVLGIFVVLGIIALVIDRRALLVSALSYAGIAVAYLISQSVSGDLSLPLALLGLAILVLSLSAGWRTLRRVLLPALPLGRWRDRLPPVEPA